MPTNFVKKIKVNDDNIVAVDDVNESFKGFEVQDDIFYKVPNNTRILNPKYIITIDSLPTNTRVNLLHPTWFSVQGADLVPVIDKARNSTIAGAADGAALIENMIGVWDAYVGAGPQPWSVFGEDASIVQYLMRYTSADIATLPWEQSDLWFSYRTEGKNDYAIRLVGDTHWETQIRSSLVQSASLAAYPFASATANLLTDGTISIVYVYYLPLVNVRLEDDMYTETIPWEEGDEFIRVHYNNYEFSNGDVINTDKDPSIELTGSWPNDGSFGVKNGLTWSSNSQTTSMKVWSETEQDWVAGARFSGDSKWRFSDPEATPDKPTKITIDTWTCLYKDTLITMADGSLKPICDIQPNDKVLTPYGVETVDAVKGPTCQPFAYYTEYFIDNTSLKVIRDHRILHNNKYVHISTIPNLARAIRNEECLPYSIYTNKTNTYYANGIACGTFFSNSKFRMKVFYPIYRKFFLKAKKLGLIRRWLLRKFIEGGARHD